MEAAGGPFSSTLSVNLQILPPQRLPITAWDSRADDTESRIGTKLNDHQPAQHLFSLVGSQCSGELLIIAREPAKQRRAAGEAGIVHESAC